MTLSQVSIEGLKQYNFKNFEDIEEIIWQHRAITHPIFDYVLNRAMHGFTAKQYQVYRDNFLYRTYHTIPCVAYLNISAALNLDFKTLASAGKNLYEETGCGNPAKAHSLLLESSHNLHGETVFGIPAMPLPEAVHSEFIVPEAKNFVDEEAKLYKSKHHGIVLGAAYAHETAANPMLVSFYEGFFLSYKSHYSEREFYSLTKYFLEHITGVEEEHAYQAQCCAKEWCYKTGDLALLCRGTLAFLDAQAALWDGIYRDLINFEDEKTLIAVNMN